jgi:glycosyltransferase involved in cell wall biosynthesis
MPTYNRAEYIRETIESIRNQTYQNWELIIVDDGSEDHTEEIVSQIDDRRINFFKAGRIGINGKVKNIGLKKAKGELIAFMDSDDLWAETKIEKQVAALEQFADADFSFTGGYNFRDPDQPIDFFYKHKEGMRCGDILISIFKSEISTTTPSLLMRKKCLELVGPFDETKPFSDVNFILKLASRFKAVILYEPLLYRRLHNSNDSGANWIEGYRQGVAMIHDYQKNLPGGLAADAFFRLYINFGEDCLAHKKPKTAARNFFLAWKYKPWSIVPFKKLVKAFLHRTRN